MVIHKNGFNHNSLRNRARRIIGHNRIYRLAIGSSLGLLENIESGRADIVKWLIMGFAIAYFIYGIRKSMTGTVHRHSGKIHSHKIDEKKHSHKNVFSNPTTFWVLFIIFAFGPCEVLIPLLMFPAFEFDWASVVYISTAFSISTIATMLTLVTIFYFGLKIVPINFDRFAKYNHAITGAVIAFCGLLMFLGL